MSGESVAERYGQAIFELGVETGGVTALIEDFHFMDDPAWRFGGNYLHVESNYLLLVENLLDTTHLPFLHPNTLGTDAFARSEFEVSRQGDRSKGMNMWNLNAITPETQKTAHYFFAQAYNFKLDERWVSDMLRTQVHNIFLEDMAIIRAQQQNMDLGPSPVQNLAQDKAWVAMRQIVQRLIQEEQQHAAAA